jgi:hypothetical protein
MSPLLDWLMNRYGRPFRRHYAEGWSREKAFSA